MKIRSGGGKVIKIGHKKQVFFNLYDMCTV